MSFENVGTEEVKGHADGEIELWRDALAATAETAIPREDCPEPERIWDAVYGKLAPDDLRETLDHTTTCAVCAEAWQLAGELTREEADSTIPANDEGTFWGNWTRIAALVVLLAGAAFVFRDPPSTVERSGDPVEITALTPSTEAQPRDSLILRWTPLPADDGPRVTYDVDLVWETAQAPTLLFREEGLTRTVLPVPFDRLGSLPEGELTLFWKVIAKQGEEVVSRKTFTVKVR